MAANFHFAYLGREHTYYASVTRVLASGHPLERPKRAFFRLPQSFCERLENAPSRYLSNISGHDFLSHTSRWTDGVSSGLGDAVFNSIEEIRGLALLAAENKQKGYSEADLKVSFGPQPGSFFADAYSLKRYHWANLPTDLEFELQKEWREKNYGKIINITINAIGGWVMQIDGGSGKAAVAKIFGRKKEVQHFHFGGVLPPKLKKALTAGREDHAKIAHVFLNHQNKDEYLLVFDNGNIHVNLHREFRDSIEGILGLWAHNRGKTLKWYWGDPCECLGEHQSQRDAAYYNRRGLFQLSRNNWELALAYLREAYVQSPGNEDFRYHHRLALAAVRRSRDDKVLEEYLDRANRTQQNPINFVNSSDLSADGAFRNQYLAMMIFPQEYQCLIADLRRFQIPQNEWSYSSATDDGETTVYEIDSYSYHTQSQHRPSIANSNDTEYQDLAAESGHMSDAAYPSPSDIGGYPSIGRAWSYELEAPRGQHGLGELSAGE